MTKTTYLVRALGATVLAAAVLPWVAATPGSASPGNADNVTFCHRTGAVTNPYVVIRTDPASIIKQGHGDHTGPVFDPTGGKGQPQWGDIIPAFDYPRFGNTPAGHFPGLNMTGTGPVILANDCVPVTPPSSSPPTSSKPPTSSSAPASSTAAVSSSAAASSRAPASASVLPTKVGQSPTPVQTAAPTTAAGQPTETATAVVLGTKQGKLPKTGGTLPVTGALALSAALVLLGSALLVAPRHLSVERIRRH